MASRGSKQKKRATMRLVYIDFWSALKISFLVSIIVAAITVALGLGMWWLLDRFGVVGSASAFLTDIAGDQGAALVAGLTFSNVMTFTLVVALLEVIVVSALGAIFALVLGGITEYEPFVALTASGLPIHIVAGLGGWLTFTAMGVSYRLLAMFMLAPELERATTRCALYLGAAALAVAIAGGMLTVLLEGNPSLAFLAALAIGVVALVLYGSDVLHLYRARKRRNIELNSRMAAIALACLGVSAALVVLLLALGRLNDHIGAVVFLTAFGWLSGLGLAQLYKIVAFLTWLECYGPVLGKAPTPRVQDLVTEARAVKWFLLYFFAVWAGTAALIAGFPFGFRLAAAILLVATVGILTQLVRTRRLADVKAASRLPQGARRPRLLLSCQP